MIAVTIREGSTTRHEVVHDTSASTTTDTTEPQLTQQQLPQTLGLHIGQEECLLDQINRDSHLTELIMAPTHLHRRNIDRRLREAQIPTDTVEAAAPTEVAEELLKAGQLSTTTIDRIDRLSMISSIYDCENTLYTTAGVPADPDTIEQIRVEIELVTGFHPGRLETARHVADELPVPIDADTTELITSAVDAERALRQRTVKAISDAELMRRATRRLRAADGGLWVEAYPDVDRVSLVGVSRISAAQIDLLHALLDSTSTTVQIQLRRGTGAYLARRVPDLLAIAEPGIVVFDV